MIIKATELESRYLEGIGSIIAPAAGQAPAAGEEFTFAVVSHELGLGPRLCAGRLACAHRPASLRKMERHLLTPELLFVEQGEALVCMAPPQEAADGVMSGMIAILLRAGQSVVMDAGSWHWIPFPLGPEGALFTVVFKDRTGEEDLEIRELREEHRLEWKGRQL